MPALQQTGLFFKARIKQHINNCLRKELDISLSFGSLVFGFRMTKRLMEWSVTQILTDLDHYDKKKIFILH